MSQSPPSTVLLDIDGTLLDSNDAHAEAWRQTLRRNGHALPFERLRRLIGKGGDKLLAEVLGDSADEDTRQRLSDERRAFFLHEHVDDLPPTPGARELLLRLRDEGFRLVIATSAGGEELEALLRQARVLDLIDGAATSSDAARSKPDPDIVRAALDKAGADPRDTLMLGDTPYDIAAARAAGVDTIALRCGGWWDDASLAGAVAIYDDPATLLARLDESPLKQPRG